MSAYAARASITRAVSATATRPPWLQRLARVAADWKPWVALLLVYWIARNLPWFPFTLLAPG